MPILNGFVTLAKGHSYVETNQVLATPANPRARASAGPRWVAGQVRRLAELPAEVSDGRRACSDRASSAPRRLRDRLAAGGAFAFHFKGQPTWTEWLELFTLVEAEAPGWRGRAPGLPRQGLSS